MEEDLVEIMELVSDYLKKASDLEDLHAMEALSISINSVSNNLFLFDVTKDFDMIIKTSECIKEATEEFLNLKKMYN